MSQERGLNLEAVERPFRQEVSLFYKERAGVNHDFIISANRRHKEEIAFTIFCDSSIFISSDPLESIRRIPQKPGIISKVRIFNLQVKPRYVGKDYRITFISSDPEGAVVRIESTKPVSTQLTDQPRAYLAQKAA